MEQNLLELVGKEIKRIRESAGLTQAQFAEELGLSQPYVARLENGTQNTTLKSISKIGEKFKFNIKIHFKRIK